MLMDRVQSKTRKYTVKEKRQNGGIRIINMGPPMCGNN